MCVLALSSSSQFSTTITLSGEVDRGHSAAAQLSLDGVGGERTLDLVDVLSHLVRAPRQRPGHSNVRRPNFGSGRVSVHLNLQDLACLREVQRLLEHLRTQCFVTVQSPRPPARRAASATHR